jgi:predicted AAA+ superfamily ATPase
VTPCVGREFLARGTGKSTLLKELLPATDQVLWINLLDNNFYQKLVARPEYFLELIPKHFNHQCWVVADEIQRIPELLNLVHLLIEERKINFALTGSSARKLKRGGANLLAGRAFLNSLFPLSHYELKNDFILLDILNWGALPKVFDYQDELSKKEYLRSYVGTYIREEIKEEQIVRQLDPFVRFLETSAQMNGEIINASKISRDAMSDSKAILRYFQVLEDTLLGFFLEPYHSSVRKVQTAKSKFYFFDLGVKRALEGSLDSLITPGSSAFGKSFEHFFILECLKYKTYQRKEDKFYYIRTKDDVEIDLLIERGKNNLIAIEIKSSENVDVMELKKSHVLAKDLGAKRFIVACREKISRNVDGIEIIPWQEVLSEFYPL